MRSIHPRHRAEYLSWIQYAGLLIGGSLLLGVLGYHYLEDLAWIDALLDASMILGGMGPVSTLHTAEGKLFASFYAMYSCFVVLGAASVFLMPLMHLTLNRFHADPDKPRGR